ncbi:MAG: hypothetical protein ACKVRO_15560 [Micropepsaceae bacterium]
MLAFNRAFIEFGAHVRGLERTDDVLRLLWRDWTNTSEGGGGWWEFGAEVLTRTRISTVNLKGDEAAPVHAVDLLFRHDYGIDVVLRREDAEPVYGGWIMASSVKPSGRIVHGHHALVAEGDGLEVAYTFDPSPGIQVFRPENRAFDLMSLRRICPPVRPKSASSAKRRR